MGTGFWTADEPLQRKLAWRLVTIVSQTPTGDAGVDAVDDQPMLDRGRCRVIEQLLPVTRFGTIEDVERIANIVEGSTGVGPVNLQGEIAGIFYELALNAVQHSESAVGEYAVLECAVTPQGEIIYAAGVADGGIGIPASLRLNPEYAFIDNDADAIDLATQLHVTGTGDPRRGLGLDHVLQVVKRFRGSLIIASGRGYWNLEKGVETRKGRLNLTDRLSGTVVAVTVSVPPVR